MKSWKTTAAGIAVAISAIATGVAAVLDGDPETICNIDAMVAAFVQIVMALGLISARDNDVSSEASGAKAKDTKRAAKILKTLVLIAAIGAILPACNTLGLPGSQSSAKIDMDEVTFDEAGNENRLRLKFAGKGDVDELLQGMRYAAKPDGEWELVIDQDVAGLTSPGSLAIAEGYADLVREAPAIAEAIVPLLSAPEAPSLISQILEAIRAVSE